MNTFKIVLFAFAMAIMPNLAHAATGGTITVTSKPTGANFVVQAPNGTRITGTTPATISNLAPTSYTVSFSPVLNCRLAKAQTRALDANGHIQFLGDYLCANKIPKDTLQAPVKTPDRVEKINVHVWNSFQQKETLPGNSTLITVGVRNTGNSTLRNLTLTQAFNPNQIDVLPVLPHNGTLLYQQISWEIPVIYAGQSWTATFPITIKDSLKTGEQVQLLAKVSGVDILAPQVELLRKVATIGIADLPATGNVFMSSIAAGLGAVLAFFFSISSIRRKKSLAFIT